MKKLLHYALAITSTSIAGCASNQHLVFFTNTTIGVEIGTEPANGSPARFIVGYKRQEGVIDPLIPDYDFVPNSGDSQAPNNTLDTLTEPTTGDSNIVLTPQGTAIPKGSKNKAHSVLAKMDFGAQGGGNGASAAQFFATGRAAEYLAQSDNIAGALAGDPKINVKKTANLDTFDEGNYAYLHYVYLMLTDYINTGSPKAGDALNIKNQVDKLDADGFRTQLTEYSRASASSDYNISTYQNSGPQSFRNALTYINKQVESLKVAKKMILDSDATVSGTALTSTQKQSLVDAIASYPKAIEEGQNALSSNPSVVSMIDFVHKIILLKEKQ